jgi:hypothetical protein
MKYPKIKDKAKLVTIKIGINWINPITVQMTQAKSVKNVKTERRAFINIVPSFK